MKLVPCCQLAGLAAVIHFLAPGARCQMDPHRAAAVVAELEFEEMPTARGEMMLAKTVGSVTEGVRGTMAAFI